MQKRLFYAFLLFLSTNAFAQDAPITDCDTYAANDQDPQRKANGVPLAKLNPAVAVSACEAAVRQFPNSGRLVYQLGRAYYKPITTRQQCLNGAKLLSRDTHPLKTVSALCT